MTDIPTLPSINPPPKQRHLAPSSSHVPLARLLYSNTGFLGRRLKLYLPRSIQEKCGCGWISFRVWVRGEGGGSGRYLSVRRFIHNATSSTSSQRGYLPLDTASTLVWPSVAAQHWPQHCPPHPPTISPTSTHGSLSSGPFSVVETPNPPQMSTLHVAAIRAPPPAVCTCQQAHLFNAHPPQTLRVHASITLHPPDHFFRFMDRSKALY